MLPSNILNQRILLLIFSFLATLSLHAQMGSASRDSMEKVFDEALISYESYDYPNALQKAIDILHRAEKDEDLLYMFKAYNLMGYVQNSSKDTLKSIASQEKALAVAKRSGVDSLISWALNDLGNIYAEKDEDYEKGIGYYLEAVETNKRANLKEEENLIPLMNIGWTYLDHEEHENAYPYISQARAYANSTSQPLLLQVNLDILFGRYYLLNENYNVAEKELRAVLETAEKNDFLDQISDATKYLARLYEDQGRFEEALALTRKNNAYQKRIYNQNKIQELEEASAKFDVAQYKKETELAKLEQEYANTSLQKSKVILGGSIIATLLLLGSLLVLWRQYKYRKKGAIDLEEKNKELIIAKNEAERLSKLKTQFFSTVSHELRTPLYGVTGIASILLEDKNIKTHREDLQSLKFSADYLMALINDVLVLNKMDANGVKLEKAPFYLPKLVQNIARSFEFLIEQNKNTLHVEVDETIPKRLLGDSVRLSQILLNLVGNAIKFNENKNIWIRIKNAGAIKEEDSILLDFEIKDDGIGIAPSEQENVFDEFSQANNKNYGYQGTGLGLPIVKKLLALFGSTISLESDVNKGASFRFSIPFEKLSKTLNSESDISEKANDILQIVHPENLHILVVDDNRINQKITGKVLETRHFRCTMADNGREAVALATQNTYSLILMDINMPVMNGIEATKAIREFDTKTPIIALTAVEADEMRKTIMDSGMNDIILKPFDMLDFHNIILRNLMGAELPA